VNLLIVESPTKARKIQPMLGAGWRVIATAGHIRDLPVRELSVDAQTFQLRYEVIAAKKDVVARLRDAAKGAAAIFLATDPDREGEAIAWHLQETLRLRDAKRVTFHEITRAAVSAALREPRGIDYARVRSQEGRRALDRLVGYRVSGALRKFTGRSMSAGRVQTVAVLLVVDREDEIRQFQTRHHYVVVLTFVHEGKPWAAEWHFKPFLSSPDERLWTDKAVAERVAAMRSVRVAKCDETIANVAPPAPFTTTTLQQAASISLKLRVATTMQLAQKLFEKGHITYHRTDDPNLAPEAIEAIRKWAQAANMPLPDAPRRFKAKASAQEAHEAIRPTHIDVEDASAAESPATPEEQRLYELIRKRAIASQLADATFDVRTVVFEATSRLDGRPVHFVGRGRTPRTLGFRTLVAEDQAEERGEDMDVKNPVPRVAVGSSLEARDGVADPRKTKPAVRYTEATLVKALEAKGIGRPSTYASIISTIQARDYVSEQKDRKFAPTELGEALITSTRGKFSFVDVAFTRDMELQLDDIAEGKRTYVDVVRSANGALDRELASFDGGPLAAATRGPECLQCREGFLVKRARKAAGKASSTAFFWSCSNYPACRAAHNDVGGQPDLTPRAPRVEGGACPSCSSGTLMRFENERGAWWGCSRFRDGCTARFKDNAGIPEAVPIPTRPDPFADPRAVKCPKCKKGVLVQRTGNRGVFWSCYSRPNAKRRCAFTCEDDAGKPASPAAVWDLGRAPSQSRSKRRSISL